MIEIDHGEADSDEIRRSRTNITLPNRAIAKPVIKCVSCIPTKAQRDAGLGFGAVEYGYQGGGGGGGGGDPSKSSRHVEALRA